MTKAGQDHLWHPFTQMAAFAEESPPSIAQGKGCIVIDDRGHEYLDGISSLWCNVHGHRHPSIDLAIKDQVDQIAHTTLLGLRNPKASELATRLAAMTPAGLEWVFYSDSGSSAVEIALKMAFQMWRNRGEKRTKFIALGDAYHGDTIGSVSLGGIDLFHRIFSPLLFESLRVPAPHCLRCPLSLTKDSCQMECAGLVDELLERHSGTVAAVVMEPLVQGAAGMLIHPAGFLSHVRAACTRHDVLLICDEVATGFGRTGAMFACEHEGVSPDLMTLAKGLTGGYLPLAATLASQEVFESFLGAHEEGKHFYHGHTFTGNALACAAALASLDVLEGEKVIAGLAPKIEQLQTRLAPLKENKNVLQIRQKGLMVGIELAQDRANKAPYPPETRAGHRVTLEARKRGVIIRPLGDVVVLMPPLAISAPQIDQLAAVTIESIEHVTEQLR